jgi:hypothetical protein
MVEKINDPHFHKVHEAYFALKREYTQYLQSSPDGKTKYDIWVRLHHVFAQVHGEILKDPEFATYVFGSALMGYNRNKKMIMDGDFIEACYITGVHASIELGLYLRYHFIPGSNGKDADPGSQLDKKYTKYHRDLHGVGGNTRGLINVLARETSCDCMNDDYDRAKKGRQNTTGKLGNCYTCNKNFPKETLFQCMNCKQVRYCNAECQKEDWSNHREFCEIIHKREQLRTLTKKREEYEKDNSNEEPDSN